MTGQENFDEKVSALVDGELRETENAHAIDALVRDIELRKSWERYHIAGDAWKKSLPALPLNHQLAERVMKALESEPVILAPHRISRNFKPVLKQAAGLAIAASVTALVVLGGQSWNKIESPGSLAQSTPASAVANSQVMLATSPAPVAPISGALPNVIEEVAQANERTAVPDQTINSQLHDYLVHHNRHVAGVHGMLPYARIIGYAPNEPIE